MSSRFAMQLLMPPIMALIVLYMGNNILRSTSPQGVLTPVRVKMLWSTVLTVLVVLYAITLNQELRAFWRMSPFACVAIVLLLALALALGIQRRRRGEPQVRQANNPLRAENPLDYRGSQNFGLRARQSIVLIWGLVGIAGTIVAILWKLFHR